MEHLPGYDAWKLASPPEYSDDADDRPSTVYSMHELTIMPDGYVTLGPDMMRDYLAGGDAPECDDDVDIMLTINDEYKAYIGDRCLVGYGMIYQHRETGKLIAILP